MISEHTSSPLVLRPQVLTWHLCLLSFFHPQRQRCWSSQTTDVWHGFEQKCWTSSSVSSDFLVCLQEVPVEEQGHKLPPSSKSMNGGESLTPAGYCVLKCVCCSILLWTVCVTGSCGPWGEHCPAPKLVGQNEALWDKERTTAPLLLWWKTLDVPEADGDIFRWSCCKVAKSVVPCVHTLSYPSSTLHSSSFSPGTRN